MSPPNRRHDSGSIISDEAATEGMRASLAPIPLSTVPVPFWKNLVAGGGAGLLEIACMYPTDVSSSTLVRIVTLIQRNFLSSFVRASTLFINVLCCAFCVDVILVFFYSVISSGCHFVVKYSVRRAQPKIDVLAR